LADELCGGKLLITLEGGYNLTGMRDGAMAVLGELCGDPFPGYGLELSAIKPLQTTEVECSPLMQSISMQKNYWQL